MKFPTQQKKQTQNEPNSPTTGQHSLSDRRVLVVDDERDTRELVAALLTTCGAEVVSVGSAAEASGSNGATTVRSADLRHRNAGDGRL